MSERHGYWPAQFPRTLDRPRTTLWDNLRVSAARHGESPAIHYLGATIAYRQLHAEAEALAGWLQRHGVGRGDRVVLYLQNCPQWMIAYYAVLRADAVVVPVNPMNRANEVRHYLQDSGACAVICAQDLAGPLLGAVDGTDVRAVVSVAYSDYLPEAGEFAIPDWVKAPRQAVAGCTAWADALSAGEVPRPPQAVPQDLALLPYTSGSTGVPKGCMHTHESFMHNTAGLAWWHSIVPGSVCFGVAPMYHVSGIGQCVNVPVYAGGSVVILPRWERDLAARLIERYRVAHLSLAPTAVIDLLGHPKLGDFDLKSLRRVAAGGASMPEEVWKRLDAMLGVPFIEAYGLTETAATTHNNPFERPKRQCLGVPFFDTEARIVDPGTRAVLPHGDQGEIAVHGPQVFKGYWNRPEESAAAFTEIDGRQYFLTGDIGYADEEGYWYMTDRAKRMINASGFKVWPAEIENRLYEHPDVLEACVIGTKDAYRGESVKALVVLRAESRGRVSEAAVIDWAKERMAAYKYPRRVEFVDALPKALNGKILWRELQQQEDTHTTTTEG